MSHVEFYCSGCGARAGIAGDLSDDPEERDRELDEQYEFERMWDEEHADCDARRPVRSGIVAALVADRGPSKASHPDRFYAALAEPRAVRVARRRDARLAELRIAGRAITAGFVAGLTEGAADALLGHGFTDHSAAACPCQRGERDPHITAGTSFVK